MGISNTVLLFLGWDHLDIEDEQGVISLLLSEEEYEEAEESGDYDFEQYISDELNLENPWADGISKEEKDKRYEIREEAIEEYPVEEILYCSYDYVMYTLAVKGTERRVYRGDLEPVTPEELALPEGKIAEAKKWFETHELEWQEPKWLMTTING